MNRSPRPSTVETATSTGAVPRVRLKSLDTLWFQVGGTLCNLACRHCFISCSPTNRTHELMSLQEIRPYLEEGAALGVKEYYFTGGEPFVNPEIEAILGAALEYGPVTVLTNGLILSPPRCRRLKRLADAAEYSLDVRISIDGYDAATNDPIRGEGTFDRILEGVRNLYGAGLNPVLTVTEVYDENGTPRGKERFLELLRGLGIDKPRLKVLPVFQLGAEAERSRAYAGWQRLTADDAPEDGWDHLQCSSCRMVTDQGVWVCPILVNRPEARMGERLVDALGEHPLDHSACWTCHLFEVSCRT